MPAIYSGATSVVAWLGEGSENLELAVSWVSTCIERKSTAEASKFWLDLEAAGPSRAVELERVAAVWRVNERFREFFTNIYWTRMWTFQEFPLPIEEPVCVCGRVKITASRLEAASNAILEAMQATRATVIREFEAAAAGDPDAPAEQIQQLIKVGQERGSAPWGTLLFPNAPRRQLSAKDSSLAGCLLSTQNRGCEDSRDRGFALYGMCPAAQEAYPADYTKKLEHVLKETTAYLVNSDPEGGLAVFSVFLPRSNRLSTLDYPSWVPDFRHPDATPDADADRPSQMLRVGHRFAMAESLRRSTGSQLPRDRIDTTSWKLHLWARVLGSIKILLKFGQDKRGILRQIASIMSSDRPGQPGPMLSEGPATAGWAARADVRDKLIRAVMRASVHFSGIGRQCSNAELVPAFAELITTGGEFRMIGAGYFAGVIEDECVDPEWLGSLQQKDPRVYVVV